MKKIFLAITFVLLMTVGIDFVKGESSTENKKVSSPCIYYDEKDEETFRVWSELTYGWMFIENKPRLTSLKSMTIGDNTFEQGETFRWNKSLDMFTLENGEKLDKEPLSWHNGCKRYLYFNAKEDEVYFSDEININNYNVTYNKRYHLKEYNPSTPETTLEKLYCTYAFTKSLAQTGTDEAYSNITFEIGRHDADRNIVEYTVYGDFEKLYTGTFENGNLFRTTTTVEDHFDIRKFYDEETKVYACPSAIMVGYEITGVIDHKVDMEITYTDIKNKYSMDWYEPLLFQHAVAETYYRSDGASYVKEKAKSQQLSTECIFYEEGQNEDTNWAVGIQKVLEDNNVNYLLFSNTTKYNPPKQTNFSGFSMSKDLDLDCDTYEAIYTDCLTKSDCKVSTTQFAGSKKLVANKLKNSQDISDVESGLGIYTGFTFKEKMCSLKQKFDNLPSDRRSKLLNTEKLEIYAADGSTLKNGNTYSIDNLDCASWFVSEPDYKCSDDTCSTLDYDIDQNIRQTVDYCNTVYSNYRTYRNSQGYTARMEECISFQNFYNSLVQEGVIEGSTGCGFFSKDFGEMLQKILDIAKILAPVIAIGLGTVDFVRTVAAGDVDKELKAAGKRFLTRIGAAILLFLIPTILAFVLDIFMGNEDGYNTDNPFCGIVEWKK